MNLNEAKQLLKKYGYRLVKENTPLRKAEYPAGIADISCEYEGMSDYEEGEMPNPYVIVSCSDRVTAMKIQKALISGANARSALNAVGAEDADMIDRLTFEIIFAATDYCDSDMRMNYEKDVCNLLKQILE